MGSNKPEEVKVYEKAISSCNVDKYGAFFSGRKTMWIQNKILQ